MPLETFVKLYRAQLRFFTMSAEIINIWDYRRKEEKLKEQAAEILSQIDTSPSEMIPDGIPYQAPPEDCA